MSFLAWDVKAPRGFGRLHGYTAPIPGLPPGTYAGSTSVTVDRAMSATVASVAPMVVNRTVQGPAYQVSVSAPTLAPRIGPAGSDDMVRQIARAGENIADQSGRTTDATRAGAGGDSADDAVGIPPGTAPGDAGPIPSPGSVPGGVRTIPWWVYFAGGAVGGGLLAALLAR